MNNTKKTAIIYTVESRFYSDSNIEQFDDTNEGIKKLWDYVDSLASEGGSGRGEHFRICRYEVEGEPITKNSRNNTYKNRPCGGTYYSSNDRLVFHDEVRDEDIDLESEEFVEVSYYEISEDDEGNYVDDCGECYDTEEEAHEANRPSLFYDLP